MEKEKVIHVKRWGMFEVSLKGPSEGNPFVEQSLTGIFTSKEESIIVNGFYDGDGVYKMRFMPSYEGSYSFVIRTSFSDKGFSGFFVVDPPLENNHGPVRVKDTYHFAYEDDTPYVSIGTTSYVWHLQDEDTKRETLETLKNNVFNKMRFCIFPKHYVFNLKDPSCFPYVGTPVDASLINEDNYMDYTGKQEGNDFDKTMFNPTYFQNIDEQIQNLADLGIEADLILFHPYDRWGFSTMSAQEEELYLKYVINRFSAYHNVWWSLANEWDLLKHKTVQDWQRNASILVKNDPYHHLRSIHNCLQVYDQNEDWITHVSYQRIDVYKTVEVTNELREQYHKPVVMDELGYEGDIQFGWGNLTPQEEVRRFYETVLRGGYPGHSETYLDESHVLWWSHGGTLRGESHKRFAFLKEVLSGVPGKQIAPNQVEWDSTCGVPECEKDEPIKSQYIYYFSFMRPSYRDFFIDDETDYAVDVIDTWNMTIRFAGVFHGKFRVALPGTQYIAVRLRKASEMDLVREVEVDKSVRLKEEHPFVDQEEANVQEELVEERKDSVEPMEEDANEYLEATVVSDKTNVPFSDVDDDVHEVQQEVEETPVEEEGSFDDLELPKPSPEDDELPSIVTKAISTISDEEVHRETNNTHTLRIPKLNFFKKK